MRWTGLYRVLTLKVTGGIPWLVVVPVLATIIEFANSRFGFAPRLPYSILLMFLVSLVFFVVQIIYSMGCPATLKGIGSQEEWSQSTSNKRKEIIRGLEQDKALKALLLAEVERRIDESLKHDFSAAQIEIVKHHLKEGVQGTANLLGDSIGSVADTSIDTFIHLNQKNSSIRWMCTSLIGLGFALLGIVLLLRLVSVYHAALG